MGTHGEITDLLIGGTEPGAGNLISGNHNQAIRVFGPGAQGITIQGNKIGTDIDGVNPLPNGRVDFQNGGVLIDSANGVVVGGTEERAGNLISGNNGNGVTIIGGSEHAVQGNNIGTDNSGNNNVGNSGDGIHIVDSRENQIGGTDNGAGNVISGNSGDGIHIEGGSMLPSLVGEWKADGDANDAVAGNNGEIFGATFTEGARDGQAFQFDGVDDFVRVPNSAEYESQTITLSAWVKATGPADFVDYFVAKGGHVLHGSSYTLYQINGMAYFSIFNGTFGTDNPQGTRTIRSPGIAAEAIYDGEWHQLTGSYDGQHVRLYVDGEEIGAGTETDVGIRYDLASLPRSVHRQLHRPLQRRHIQFCRRDR